MPAANSIYLMSVDWDQRARAARAIYQARKALGQEASHRDAYDAVRRCYNDGNGYRGISIGVATSEGTLVLAQQSLDDAGDALVYAVNPTPEQVLAPDTAPPTIAVGGALGGEDKAIPAGDKPREVFEPEVYETAMMLLCGMRGSPFAALSLAGGLARSTRSDSFKRVQSCLLSVFPADSAVSAALVQAVLDDEDV